MNPEPALATLEPEVVDNSPATAAKEKEEKCGKGNVAALPKVLRDQVNTMLDDGVPYRLIIKKLNESTDPPLPWPISEVNISRWKNNGYQKYLVHQDLRADIRFIRESATDFSELNEEHQFQNTLIQLGLTDIYRELTDPKTRTDPLKHIRILNALARLNREALNLRKYNDLRADNAAAAQPIGATRAPTAEEICNSFLTGFETVTGIKPADGPIGPDINHILDPNGSALAAPTCRAEASERRRKSDEGGSALAAPERSGGGSAPALRSAPDEGGSSSSSSSSSKSAPSDSSDSSDKQSQPTSANSKSNTQKLKMKIPSLTDPLTHLPTRPAASQLPVPPRRRSTPQPSTVPAASPELCYSCGVPLPPLKPDGTRPSPSCPGCHIRLHPPGTTYDHCPNCNAYQAISASGERLSKECDGCHQVLPPVGHRYTAECPSCGLGLNNFTHDGARVIERCPDCRTLLPLHEPIPPLSQTSSSTLSDTLSNTKSPPDSAAPNPVSAGEDESLAQPSTPPPRQSKAPAEAEASPLTNSLTGSPTDSLPPALAA